MLTREQMLEVIEGGGSLSYRGRMLTMPHQVPAQAELDALAEEAAGSQPITLGQAEDLFQPLGEEVEPYSIGTWLTVGADGVPFENGWTGAPAGHPRYAKDTNGWVRVEGYVSGASADAITVFTLPVGMRPDRIVRAIGSGIRAGNPQAPVKVEALTSGEVQAQDLATSNTEVFSASISLHFYVGP